MAMSATVSAWMAGATALAAPTLSSATAISRRNVTRTAIGRTARPHVPLSALMAPAQERARPAACSATIRRRRHAQPTAVGRTARRVSTRPATWEVVWALARRVHFGAAAKSLRSAIRRVFGSATEPPACHRPAIRQMQPASVRARRTACDATVSNLSAATLLANGRTMAARARIRRVSRALARERARPPHSAVRAARNTRPAAHSGPGPTMAAPTKHALAAAVRVFVRQARCVVRAMTRRPATRAAHG